MPRALSGASTFSNTVSQGKSAKLWKTMATLTIGAGDRRLMPVDLARRGFGETGEHAKQRGLAGAGGAEQRDDLPGLIDRSVGEMTWMRFSLGCA